MHIKNQLRQELRLKRRAIPAGRREQAEKALLEVLPELIRLSCVMSYASFDDEFSTNALNIALSAHGKLVLPRVIDGPKKTLQLFKVTDLKQQLKQSIMGIWEPDPERCELVAPDQVSLCFVPALAFDKQGHRLGYGLGVYDAFLPSLSESCVTCGLGFHEQLLEHPLPTWEGDVPVQQLTLL